MVKKLSYLQITLMMLFAVPANYSLGPIIQRSSPVAVGEVAPDFMLSDERGNKVSLSEYRGKSPVVLVFYRGYW
jgi:cytochrome oxidase Cu insertion factor (SCO1/SenC/PrrC family)